MLNPKQFSQILRQHFADVTPEQFKENLQKFCPEIFVNQSDLQVENSQEKVIRI